jgi:hypothetical protein
MARAPGGSLAAVGASGGLTQMVTPMGPPCSDRAWWACRAGQAVAASMAASMRG